MPRKEAVTKIIDGDTFETSRRKHPVRLAGVDAPEKRQPGYREAKAKLQNLIGGKQVTVDFIRQVRRGVLENSLFPETLTDPTGTFHKPPDW